MDIFLAKVNYLFSLTFCSINFQLHLLIQPQQTKASQGLQLSRNYKNPTQILLS